MTAPQATELGDAGLTLDAHLPHTAFSRVADRVVLTLGALSSVVWGVLVLSILTGVFQRYALSQGTVFIEELQWHLYAAGIAFAIAFCVANDSHIRVDVISRKLSPRRAAWVELFGIVLFLLPYALFVLWHGIDFVNAAYVSGETSMAPEGISHRWVVKSLLPIAFALLTLAAVSRLTRCIAFLRNPADQRADP